MQEIRLPPLSHPAPALAPAVHGEARRRSARRGSASAWFGMASCCTAWCRR